MLRSTLIAVVLATLAVSSAGQEKIKLKSGKVVSGRATAYDSQKEVLSFRTDDGQEVKSVESLNRRIPVWKTWIAVTTPATRTAIPRMSVVVGHRPCTARPNTVPKTVSETIN